MLEQGPCFLCTSFHNRQGVSEENPIYLMNHQKDVPQRCPYGLWQGRVEAGVVLLISSRGASR